MGSFSLCFTEPLSLFFFFLILSDKEKTVIHNHLSAWALGGMFQKYSANILEQHVTFFQVRSKNMSTIELYTDTLLPLVLSPNMIFQP